jgi:DNA-binding TFAR19-related protein (PDSD5 family)
MDFKISSTRNIVFFTYDMTLLSASERSLSVKQISLEDLPSEQVKAYLAAENIAYVLGNTWHFPEAAAKKMEEHKVEKIVVHSKEGKSIISTEEIEVRAVTNEELLKVVEQCLHIATRSFPEEETKGDQAIFTQLLQLLQEGALHKEIILELLHNYSEIVHKIIESFQRDRAELKQILEELAKREELARQRLVKERLNEEVENGQIALSQAIHERHLMESQK